MLTRERICLEMLQQQKSSSSQTEQMYISFSLSLNVHKVEHEFVGELKLVAIFFSHQWRFVFCEIECSTGRMRGNVILPAKKYFVYVLWDDVRITKIQLLNSSDIKT